MRRWRSVDLLLADRLRRWHTANQRWTTSHGDSNVGHEPLRRHPDTSGGRFIVNLPLLIILGCFLPSDNSHERWAKIWLHWYMFMLIQQCLLTFHSNMMTAIPEAAPEPAIPTKLLLPMLLANRDNPTWRKKKQGCVSGVTKHSQANMDSANRVRWLSDIIFTCRTKVPLALQPLTIFTKKYVSTEFTICECM